MGPAASDVSGFVYVYVFICICICFYVRPAGDTKARQAGHLAASRLNVARTFGVERGGSKCEDMVALIYRYHEHCIASQNNSSHCRHTNKHRSAHKYEHKYTSMKVHPQIMHPYRVHTYHCIHNVADVPQLCYFSVLQHCFFRVCFLFVCVLCCWGFCVLFLGFWGA